MADRNVPQNKGVLALDLSTAFGILIKAVQKGIGRRVSGKIVTLDIDGDGIKLLEVRGNVIRKWAQVVIAPSSGDEEEILDRQSLRDAVRQLTVTSGSKLGSVSASISGLYSISRILPMPTVPSEVSTQEFVQEIVGGVMPVSMDRLYLSWQILANADSGGDGKILAIGMPRIMLDNEVRSLRALGVYPRILELRAIALTRAVNRKQAVIINMEPSSVDIVIVVDDVPEIIRTIAWQQDGFAVEDKVEQVAANLGLTVDFYNANHFEAPVDMSTPLFFTGQMSLDLDLTDKLRDRLGYPVESFTPQFKYPPDMPVSQYAVNIGLALRGTEQLRDDGEGGRLRLDINLLPSIYNPWRPSARQVFSFLAVVAAMGLLFPFFMVTTEAMDKTAGLQLKSDSLNSQLEIKKAEIKKREPIQRAVNEYKGITEREGSFMADIDVIWNEAAQLRVEVGSITHDGSVITFSCVAEDFLAFRRYLTALEESGRFMSPIPPPEKFPYVKSGTIQLEVLTGE